MRSALRVSEAADDAILVVVIVVTVVGRGDTFLMIFLTEDKREIRFQTQVIRFRRPS